MGFLILAVVLFVVVGGLRIGAAFQATLIGLIVFGMMTMIWFTNTV